MENLALDLLLGRAIPATNPYIVYRSSRRSPRELRVEMCNRGDRSRSYKIWIKAVQGWAVASVLTVIDGGRTSCPR
jgi:hypothetical protein